MLISPQALIIAWALIALAWQLFVCGDGATNYKPIRPRHGGLLPSVRLLGIGVQGEYCNARMDYIEISDGFFPPCFWEGYGWQQLFLFFELGRFLSSM